jgi:hypothetical protein
MIKQLAGRAACVFGVHQRSRGHARAVGNHMESLCRYCGAHMEKRDGGKWIVALRR